MGSPIFYKPLKTCPKELCARGGPRRLSQFKLVLRAATSEVVLLDLAEWEAPREKPIQVLWPIWRAGFDISRCHLYFSLSLTKSNSCPAYILDVWVSECVFMKIFQSQCWQFIVCVADLAQLTAAQTCAFMSVSTSALAATSIFEDLSTTTFWFWPHRSQRCSSHFSLGNLTSFAWFNNSVVLFFFSLSLVICWSNVCKIFGLYVAKREMSLGVKPKLAMVCCLEYSHLHDICKWKPELFEVTSPEVTPSLTLC